MKFITESILVLAALSLSPTEINAGAIFSPLLNKNGRKLALRTGTSENWGQMKDGSLCVELKGKRLTWETCKQDRDSQLWKFENDRGGVYDGRIYSKDNEHKCIKIPSDTGRQLKVVQCRDKEKQRWYFDGDAIVRANNHNEGIWKSEDKRGVPAILTKDFYSMDFALD